MRFDFWQRWGVALDDVAFANAFLALGLVSPDRQKRSVDELRNYAAPALQLPWYFPHPATPVEGAPEEWARAWADVRKTLKRPVRLYVMEAPPEEPILPWYRLLYEASPAPDAVALFERSPRAQFHMEWPLRLGGLSEQAWAFLQGMQAKNLWPARKVARMVRLGREQANCDLLLHRGPPRTLLQELLALPFEVKANVVLVQGDVQTDWAELQALLASVLAQTRASGFVLLPAPAQDDGWLLEFFNRFLAEMSHAHPVDAAFALARPSALARQDLVAGFTPEILGFALPQLVERYNLRTAALPPRTDLDLSAVGPANEWLTRGVEGGGMAGGGSRSAMPPDADRRVAAASVRMRAEEMMFDSEGHGGSTIAEMAEAVAAAAPPPEAEQARAARFLQQKSFVRPGKEWQEAKEGFVAEAPAMVRVRIAAPEKGWDTLPSAFPVEALPRELERWTLTVWLSEPEHLAAPLRRQIRLPRDGDSTECEFRFKPRERPRFEGRLTVVHRGRVIQTAVLRAGVLLRGEPVPKEGAPRLADPVVVRHRLGNLDERRQFDLALVANHDTLGRPLLTAVSDKAAWVNDLTQMPAISLDINNALSAVAKTVKDYAKGLEGEKGRSLMIQLAQKGGWLKRILGVQLDDPANHPVGDKHKYVQIVSTRVDSVVPLEFMYDYQPPEDGAKPCKHWREQLPKGECRASCDRTSGSTFCPLGFWGLKKVIERHAITPGLAKDGHVLYLEMETSRQRDTLYLGGAALLSGSSRVPKAKMTELEGVLTARCGVAPERAGTFAQWEDLVKEHRPRLIVSLPHTGGTGSDVNLEIGGQPAVKTITLKPTHVFPPPVQGRQAPLVALLGCDIAGTANDYGYHVLALRGCGAGIVIGTIATVFGEHAAQVAGKLVEGMLPEAGAKPVRLGELMLDIKRKSLLDGLLMPLCVVAYGDADWKLSREKPADG